MVPPLSRITPDDPRYVAVVDKRFNKRFRGRPDYVYLATSTDEVVSAVDAAVRDGKRVVATSGGHCLEGFVSDPDVRVVIDVSPMKHIYYDAERRAIAVEAGATVGDTFKHLAEFWGVVVPLGEYPAIGMGGHVPGGAFGFLCRELGLAVDYLYGVEVVVVANDGHVSAVVATRDDADPNRDLWWAHTGGGAGNFGIVTRFWFRSPDATDSDPAKLLPPAPESVTTFKAEWNWVDVDRASFATMMRNHGEWCEQNSDADSPNASLFALFEIHRQQFGKIIVRAISTSPSAQRQWNEHIDALCNGAPRPAVNENATMSWLDFALNPFPELFAGPPSGVSAKIKDALLRRRLDDRQIDVVYDYLTRTDHDVMGGVFGLATYGGRINTVPSDATAASQRGAILDAACNVGWLDSAEEAKNVAWVRAFYRDLFADSGGVPTPGERYDGAFINHPDTDLVDPSLNTSGVPWHRLYYKDNYPRLQRVKTQWDPRNVFHHALSIRAT